MIKSRKKYCAIYMTLIEIEWLLSQWNLIKKIWDIKMQKESNLVLWRNLLSQVCYNGVKGVGSRNFIRICTHETCFAHIIVWMNQVH